MPQFRPDRLATLYFFHPMQRLLSRASSGIPVLMYHSISSDPEDRSRPYYRTCTSPERFCEQMDFLSHHGYQVISLSQAVRKLAPQSRIQGKFVVLTFDDGFADFYTQAFPILSRFGYTATMYLPTESIGDRPLTFKDKECLTWSQVRELQRAGIEFGSHTVTHPQLRTVPMTQVRDELRDSKQQIENRLGEKVTSFSYPYAFPEADRPFRQDLRSLLTEFGYQNGVSTIIGTVDASSDRYFLERLPVNSADDISLFSAKLRGGYDWLHAAQLASKRLRPATASLTVNMLTRT